MIENIIEDGLNDFFYNALFINSVKAAGQPIHFTGRIAFGFKDVLTPLVHNYQLQTWGVF